MLQWIVVLAVAFAAYYFLHNWWIAGAVIVLYLVISIWYRRTREHQERVQGAIIVGTKLSDDEKMHMGNQVAHNSQMESRQLD